MNSDTVDLIYLDPPFNSKTNYAAPIGSQAAGAEFKDTWTLSDLDVEWVNLIESKHPALYRVIMAAMTDSDKSYLVYMAARLLEMKRLLKPAGSIYLHCDNTMSHYLKLTLDAVFGIHNFRNEITWKRNSSHNDSKQWGRISDKILFYGAQINRDDVRVPLDPDYIKKFYKYEDEERGVYNADNLSAKGLTGGGYYYDFYGHPGPWRYPEHRMKELDDDDRIHLPKKEGGVPRLKRFLSDNKGKIPPDIWIDIPPVQGRSKESTKYPTQKPLALLNRIIRASSNEGDTILDPFCGCATTCVAADILDRNWVGIDISEKAYELVNIRLRKNQGAVYNQDGSKQMSLLEEVIHRTDIPHRTDLGKLPKYNCKENKTNLYGLQEGNCNGCDEHFQIRHLTVDHIIAQSKGGTDHIDNLQLLCAHCNSVKGNRGMEYLHKYLRLAA